jgi:hypothetical protein
MNLEDAAVSPLLTVLSVRTAIAMGILAALWTRQADILGAFRPPLEWQSFLTSLVWKDPKFFGYYAVTVALFLATVTTLVALLCYDYSLRFDWKQPAKIQIKLALRQRAHVLGALGFYCLAWSLAAITFLLDPILSVVAATVVFVAVWYYYFFPVGAFVLPTVTTGAAKDITDTTAILVGTVNANGSSTAAYFEYGSATSYDEQTSDTSLAGSTEEEVSKSVSGLKPGTTYHYRIRAGTTLGDDRAFSTSQ